MPIPDQPPKRKRNKSFCIFYRFGSAHNQFLLEVRTLSAKEAWQKARDLYPKIANDDRITEFYAVELKKSRKTGVFYLDFKGKDQYGTRRL